jgi:hypothetical protein
MNGRGLRARVGGDVAEIVADVPLLESMASCKCGSRNVDVTIFVDHDNWEAACRACGVVRPGWVGHTILGEGSDRRSSYLHLEWGRRFEIFKRDGFCCVHCDRPAQRAGRTTERLDALFRRELGENYDVVAARNRVEHAQACAACGQTLPGIFQQIAYADFARLPALARREWEEILDAGRLTIDHLLPVAELERDGIVREGPERKLVSQQLTVTSCYGCNWGRRDSVESLDEIIAVLRATVFRDRVRDLNSVLGELKEIHFRASLSSRKAKRAG